MYLFSSKCTPLLVFSISNYLWQCCVINEQLQYCASILWDIGLPKNDDRLTKSLERAKAAHYLKELFQTHENKLVYFIKLRSGKIPIDRGMSEDIAPLLSPIWKSVKSFNPDCIFFTISRVHKGCSSGSENTNDCMRNIASLNVRIYDLSMSIARTSNL